MLKKELGEGERERAAGSIILTVLRLELYFFFLFLWHRCIRSLVWSEEILVTQAVHIPTYIIVVISSTKPSHFKCRGKQEWKCTFLKLLITAKWPVPFSHDTSNFHREPRRWLFFPSINFAESYNCNVLTEAT